MGVQSPSTLATHYAVYDFMGALVYELDILP